MTSKNLIPCLIFIHFLDLGVEKYVCVLLNSLLVGGTCGLGLIPGVQIKNKITPEKVYNLCGKWRRIMAKDCNCEWCQVYSKVLKIKDDLNVPEDVRKFVWELFEKWGNIDAEYGYQNAILDGSWPQSVEILELHLAKAKEIKSKRGKENDDPT